MNPTEWGIPTRPALSTEVGDGTVAPQIAGGWLLPFSRLRTLAWRSPAASGGGAAHTWIRKLPEKTGHTCKYDRSLRDADIQMRL